MLISNFLWGSYLYRMKGVKIAVEQLQPGIYIQLPLRWSEHPFLFSRFKIKNQEEVQVIRGLGVSHVIAYPVKSDTKPIPLTEVKIDRSVEKEHIEQTVSKLEQEKDERIEKLKSFRKDLNKTEKVFQRSMTHVRNIMKDVRSRPIQAVEQAAELINEMTDVLLNKDNMVLHLMNETKEDENLYYHSLNVSVLAMMLARNKGLEKEHLNMIGMAALFHDIGKLKIPTPILRKTEPLNTAEENLLKLHPQYGVELLSLSDGFEEESKMIVEQHHEYVDGSGYPKGLKASAIHPLAQILSVVNDYDALCHPFDIKQAKTPYAALSFLFKQQKARYNEEALSLLVKLLGIYPPGTVVELDNGQCGLVISVNLQKLLFPNILVYDPNVPREQAAIIDLNDVDIKIVKALHPRKLKPEVYEYLSPRTRINYYFDHSKAN